MRKALCVALRAKKTGQQPSNNHVFTLRFFRVRDLGFGHVGCGGRCCGVGGVSSERPTHYTAHAPSSQRHGTDDAHSCHVALAEMIASRTIPGGTPFVASDLAAPVVAQDSDPTRNRLNLSEGMRAIALPIKAETAVAGLLDLGDRVDILLSYKTAKGIWRSAPCCAMSASSRRIKPRSPRRKTLRRNRKHRRKS
ncbi:RcpC/CpaB family pilus assembly protein [Celeribacter persicus]|uniref:RcpC/CpaB family pilus assembly protein n=1 Tax=Celeribacter persicus TaxID=1651082 RepID=UPI003CCB8AB3